MHNYEEFNGLEFEVKDIHLKLLDQMYIGWNDNVYYGYVCMNEKRPYGNSNVTSDVLDLLGVESEDGDYTEEQEELALDIHRQMYIVFRILIDNKSIKTGIYKRENIRSWECGHEWRPLERKIDEIYHKGQQMIPEIKLKPSIYLSPEDIQKILNDYIYKNYNYEISTLRFDVRTITEGYGPSEIDVTKFVGCDIKLKEVKNANC